MLVWLGFSVIYALSFYLYTLIFLLLLCRCCCFFISFFSYFLCFFLCFMNFYIIEILQFCFSFFVFHFLSANVCSRNGGSFENSTNLGNLFRQWQGSVNCFEFLWKLEKGIPVHLCKAILILRYWEINRSSKTVEILGLSSKIS